MTGIYVDIPIPPLRDLLVQSEQHLGVEAEKSVAEVPSRHLAWDREMLEERRDADLAERPFPPPSCDRSDGVGYLLDLVARTDDDNGASWMRGRRDGLYDPSPIRSMPAVQDCLFTMLSQLRQETARR